MPSVRSCRLHVLLSQQLRATAHAETALHRAFEALDDELLHQSRQDGTNEGCTAVACLIAGRPATAASPASCLPCCKLLQVPKHSSASVQRCTQLTGALRSCQTCSPDMPADCQSCVGSLLYTAHAGDSRAVLARGAEGCATALRLTQDHKPDVPCEKCGPLPACLPAGCAARQVSCWPMCSASG